MLVRTVLMMIALGLGVETAISQSPDQGVELEWQEGRPLVWSDFPFIRLRSTKKEVALTSVKHSVVGKMLDGKPDFQVKVLFIAKDSWTTDSTNVSLLAHEQLHFDIGELFRRRIETKIERLQKSGEQQRAIYRYAIRKLLNDFREFSKRYDKETRHGSLKNVQAEWRDDVWSELNRLH